MPPAAHATQQQHEYKLLLGKTHTEEDILKQKPLSWPQPEHIETTGVHRGPVTQQ